MIKAAVIGVGSMGKNHARIYHELENVELIAVADPNEENGKKIAEKFHCKHYTNYKDMLENENIDCATIAVPNNLHRNVAIDVINKKINVLVEKPIAVHVQEADEIIANAKKNNIVLMVGHIERFNPAVNALKAMIQEGKLGQISSINAKRVGYFPPQIAAHDTNVIIDVAVHDIDIFNYLLDATPEKVFAFAGRALHHHNGVDFANIILNYAHANAIIEVNWITPLKIRKLEVTGTKGYAELNYISQELSYYKGFHEIFEEAKENINSFNFVQKLHSEQMKVNVDKEEPLKLELAHFIDCITHHKKPIVTGEDGRNALKIVLDVVKSYKENVSIKE